MKRRDFIKHATAAAALLGCFPAELSAIERERKRGKLEKRSLGKTGAKLSILGFGAFVLNKQTPEKAVELVQAAIQTGINYFDVAPNYGTSEELLGPALEPYRKEVFLSCKTARRNRTEALQDLERSLQRLRTDHFDLWQLHHVTTMKDVDEIFAADGAIHALKEARASGKAKWLGFSAHSVEAAMALMDRFEFDSIMFPVNYATWHNGNFGPQVLERARREKMGILALKAMAKRPWERGADRKGHTTWYEPMIEPEEALQGLRFTLSHPVTSALQPADVRCLEVALKVIDGFKPLKKAEIEAMKQQALNEKPLFRYPREERAEGHAYYCMG